MKKCFAIFCAIALTPMFSAQAWLGGPFSNNSYGTVGGADGVYEAFASARNGIGLYRIIVGNEFVGVNPTAVVASVPSVTVVPPGTTIPVPAISSGNVVVGALGGFSNIWFYEGVRYTGTANGTVNDVLSRVTGIGSAADTGGVLLDSGFTARLDRKTRDFIPVRGFTGSGRARITGSTTVNRTRFNFTVIGTKVSENITFGL